MYVSLSLLLLSLFITYIIIFGAIININDWGGGTRKPAFTFFFLFSFLPLCNAGRSLLTKHFFLCNVLFLITIWNPNNIVRTRHTATWWYLITKIKTNNTCGYKETKKNMSRLSSSSYFIMISMYWLILMMLLFDIHIYYLI